MPNKPTDNPTTSRRGAFSEYLGRRPILSAFVAALGVLLPVLVTAYLQLRAGLVEIEEKQAAINSMKSEVAKSAEIRTDEVEAKATKLERVTRDSQRQLVDELRGFRESLATELATLYSDVATLSVAVERLSARLELLEADVDPDERLRNEARVLFPDLNVDEMDIDVLRRLVGIVHGERVADRLPKARGSAKPNLGEVELPPQDSVFLIAP